MCSVIAQAKDNPSKVLVPLPTSSKSMKLLSVALFSMFDASFISTKKVLSPPARLSLAPTLVNNLSTIPILAFLAGTKHPIWAMTTIKPNCLK